MISSLNGKPMMGINCVDQNIPPSLAFDFASVLLSEDSSQPVDFLDC